MSDRDARLGLSAVTEPGDPQIAAAIQHYGMEGTWDRLINGQLPDALGFAVNQARDFQAERTLELAAHAGARFIVPGDPEWPVQLADLTDDHLIRDRGGTPLGLWVAGGGNLAELSSRSVTIVGSRACTTYGEVVATELAHQLSVAGHTVVSGGAYGIDAAAHRGALAAGTPTVVVLASGVDRPHPPAHRQLFSRVAERGVIVSEVEPGAYPTRARFLARSRILAALSQGTVLVEAGARSGALDTVRWARQLARVVGVVPGAIGSLHSRAPHELIRNGEARLMDCAADLLSVLPRGTEAPAVQAAVWERVPTPGPGSGRDQAAGVIQPVPAVRI
jgi:DNA processing protein